MLWKGCIYLFLSLGIQSVSTLLKTFIKRLHKIFVYVCFVSVMNYMIWIST